MTQDRLIAAATLIIGLTTLSLGLWAYLGRSAGRYFGKWLTFGSPYLTPSSVMMLLPGGLGITFIGAALAIGKNGVTEQMLVVGLFLMVAGWVVYFIHPWWIQPLWMRRR